MELLKKSFPNFPYFFLLLSLKKELKHSHSVLDIGCGGNSPLSNLSVPYLVGLDAFKPNLNRAKKNKTHNKYIYADIRQINDIIQPNTFDTVVALDVIEHISKKEGRLLLKNIEQIARKKIIIFTPNGFMHQHSHNGDLEEHVSGWKATEMTRLGYMVYGFYGPSFLRSEGYEIRFWPKIIWGGISEIINYFYTRRHPQKATAILCIKELESSIREYDKKNN